MEIEEKVLGPGLQVGPAEHLLQPEEEETRWLMLISGPDLCITTELPWVPLRILGLEQRHQIACSKSLILKIKQIFPGLEFKSEEK